MSFLPENDAAHMSALVLAIHRGRNGKVFHDHEQHTIMGPYPSLPFHCTLPQCTVCVQGVISGKK